MAYEQQIAKLKGHARAFVDELEWIIQCFELVQPAIKNQDLNSAFSGNKRTLGFRVFRRSVARYSILGITRLTYDRGGRNPTAGRLIAALTCPGADCLREELRTAFARPMPPGEVPGRPPTELDLAVSKKLAENDIAEGRQDFDRHLFQLKEQWQWFSENETTFKDFRDKRLAHLDVSKYEDEYGPTEIQPLQWDLTVEALRRLIAIAKLLSTILANEGRDFDQFERLAKRDAKDFWQIG